MSANTDMLKTMSLIRNFGDIAAKRAVAKDNSLEEELAKIFGNLTGAIFNLCERANDESSIRKTG